MLSQTSLAKEAAKISAIAKDVSEVLSTLDLPVGQVRDLRVAYHAACSLQHGQQIKSAPKDLLKAAGYEIVEPVDSHLCCGSAGTYSILQPDLSNQLKENKVRNLEANNPDVILTANIGCQMHLESGASTPVMHWLEFVADQLPGR